MLGFVCAYVMLIPCSPIQEKDFSPAKQASFLVERFEESKQLFQKIETKKTEIRPAVLKLGKFLGEVRATQGALNQALKNPKAGEKTRNLMLVRCQGLLEAYLSSLILTLDGDTESRMMAKTLESLLIKRFKEFQDGLGRKDSS